MSTLYLHIPFCKQACHYCDFHFSTVQKTYRPVLDAMHRELDLQADFLADKTLTSIYFGGGTPSLLKAADLFSLLEKIHQQFTIPHTAEVTLEANPDDLTPTALNLFKEAGINRLSIGTQSFFDADLQLMHRAHNASEAESSIKRAQDAGFENLTIDLMYGMPNSTTRQWQQNIEMALQLAIPHLSAYALTVEPRTALAKKVATGQITLPTEETIAAQYHRLCADLKSAGFVHYELSNFGKPGMFSRHNSSYWNGTPYLGIGPSAHSFTGTTRQWNSANNTLFAKKIMQGQLWYETEELSPIDRFNEYVMTGLRTAKGLSLAAITAKFGEERCATLLHDAERYIACGQLTRDNDGLYIPEREWLISDRIIADLFWVDE